nr:MAG: hypothetical protein [Bacteriophage sp.]
MYYLCKFNEEGKREASIPSTLVNNYGGEEKLTKGGYIKITTEDYQYYVGNRGEGDNGTGYIRGNITGKPISAPARVITKEEQANVLKSEYEANIKAVDEAIQIAKNNGDDEYVRELQQERQNILNEYAIKLEELTNA